MKTNERIPRWGKLQIASIVERYFGAKGYKLERKELKRGGPRHLQVHHSRKTHEEMMKDWKTIRTFLGKEFGWAPDSQEGGCGDPSLYILTARL